MSGHRSADDSRSAAVAAPWQTTEIDLAATGSYANPYVDIDVWADFTHDDGTVLRRPAFYDGDGVWRLRERAEPVAQVAGEVADPHRTPPHAGTQSAAPAADELTDRPPRGSRSRRAATLRRRTSTVRQITRPGPGAGIGPIRTPTPRDG